MKTHLDFNLVTLSEVLRLRGGFSLSTRDTLDYDNFHFEGVARINANPNRYEWRVSAWKEGAKRKTYGFAYLAPYHLAGYIKTKFDLKVAPKIELLKVERIAIGYRLTFDIQEVYKK